jgi:uncharacterized membrane protein
MGGYFPGPVGIATFAAIKFTGNSVAGLALKKIESTITASVMKIASARSGLGVILRIPATIVGALLVGTAVPKASDAQLYLVLAVVQVFVCALLLFFLTRNSPLPRSRLWLYAIIGNLCSCLLDWPGFHLLAPGQIPVC